MQTTDGASTRSGDDQVLASAFSEMSAESGFQADQTFDSPAPADASQASGDASAAPAAAQPSTGDDGPQASSTPKTAATDPVSGATEPAADPLAGTEPFTYSVNGESKTLAGVYRVPGEGLIVPEDQVSSLQSLAERADVLDRVSREVTAQNANYERLSAWTITDEQGKEQTLTGQQGLEARHVAYARMESAVSIVDALLSDPTRILSLLAQDDTGKLMVDPSAVETLQMRIQIAANTAESQARSHLAKVITAGNQPQPASGTQSYSASAPKVMEQAAGPGFSSLTAEDRTLLSAQIDRYIRPVTEEDRRWNPSLKLGAPIVDDAYAGLVKHMVAQRQASKQTAKAAENAGKFNAGQEKGRQPAKAAPKAPAPAPKVDQGRKPKADWDSPLSGALSEMGITR